MLQLIEVFIKQRGALMNNFENNLEKYAELTIKIGVNIQDGQTLVIKSPIECVDFVRKLTINAYELGAKNVIVDFHDPMLDLIKYNHAPDEAFEEFPMWKSSGWEEMAKSGAAFLSISASNPDLLRDVKPARVATWNKTSAIAMKPFNKYIKNSNISWCVVSVPTKEWAKKVFPELSDKESLEKLWENIFKVTRVDTPDPVEVWKEHIENLNLKIEHLNSKKYIKLHYKSPGTSLIVSLPEKHIWNGGGALNDKDIYFIPNIPTEEVFTMPLKNGIDGVLSSTKPLNYAGNLIDNFSLTFKAGRIIDFKAETGYESLKQLIGTDEGSHYLGEVALVPQNSPISNSNIIFYNTLFDENASNHFAIGSAYPDCLEDGTKMSDEELEQHGINVSLTHVDFMVGSSEMSIDGETINGSLEPIFRNGNWAF